MPLISPFSADSPPQLFTTIEDSANFANPKTTWPHIAKPTSPSLEPQGNKPAKDSLKASITTSLTCFLPADVNKKRLPVENCDKATSKRIKKKKVEFALEQQNWLTEHEPNFSVPDSAANKSLSLPPSTNSRSARFNDSSAQRPDVQSQYVEPQPSIPNVGTVNSACLTPALRGKSTSPTRPFVEVIASVSIPTPAYASSTALTVPHVKRFKSIVVTRKPSLSNGNSCLLKENTPDHYLNFLPSSSPIRYLEPPCPPPVLEMQNISIPPPLMQRQFVSNWAIILSQLELPERQACCQVSRMIRYASELLLFRDYETYH
jgi:hypothetical protein